MSQNLHYLTFLKSKDSWIWKNPRILDKRLQLCTNSTGNKDNETTGIQKGKRTAKKIIASKTTNPALGTSFSHRVTRVRESFTSKSNLSQILKEEWDFHEWQDMRKAFQTKWTRTDMKTLQTSQLFKGQWICQLLWVNVLCWTVRH